MSQPITSTPRAVLWDLDGTLLDSAAYHFQAWREILAGYGFDLTHEQFIATFGWRNDRVIRAFLGAETASALIEQISSTKEARFREILQQGHVAPLPGVPAWLSRLQAGGWRQAVASSAPRLSLDAMLAALGIGSFFATTVSGDDVTRGKPDPQVFLQAAERLGVAPQCCVVVEDAPAGVEAAHRAGMPAIAVRTTHPAISADLVIDRLDQLPEDAFERLLG